ncbi:type II toxin-antitoxin system RelE/ParE family toxin [bacterium]|nr:type II toxin-antitoxin system RelE/ParE family toxin [bacterium]
MNLLFEKCFERDLKKLKDERIGKKLKRIILEIKEAQSIGKIQGLEKLRTGKRFYKINIGDYRLGLEIANKTVIFVRFLNRKDIYRFFP